MCQVIAHRGYWLDSKEKNTIPALLRALENGFGIETDFRDWCQKLVISHDIGNCDSPLAEDLFKIISRSYKQPLAINIKADGIQDLLFKYLSEFSITNYFAFDMSIPETVACIKKGLHFFSRQSEFEKDILFYHECCGIWMDCFKHDWITKDHILRHLDNGKKVCIVSPELHKRDHLNFWVSLREWNILHHQNTMLCTDLPAQAKDFLQ